jgi:hypothetical protein
MAPKPLMTVARVATICKPQAFDPPVKTFSGFPRETKLRYAGGGAGEEKRSRAAKPEESQELSGHPPTREVLHTAFWQ